MVDGGLRRLARARHVSGNRLECFFSEVGVGDRLCGTLLRPGIQSSWSRKAPGGGRIRPSDWWHVELIVVEAFAWGFLFFFPRTFRFSQLIMACMSEMIVSTG